MISKPSHGERAASIARVAIYCRKSVASKADEDFGSIDAQREAIEAYVTSQRMNGWTALPDQYDDDGFSGGTTKRPAFERLLADVEAGKVDVVAVYKIDRLSRSLADFSQLMRVFEHHGVAFVSTSQQFDTSTSMGRFTLNILASFGEFEREMIAERTRDKMLATRRRGQWTGGHPPLGYTVKSKKLVINKREAEIVREAFDGFLECQTILGVARDLNDRGYRTKTKKPFDRGAVRRLLRTPVYAGKLRAGDEIVEGVHEGIVDAQQWDRAQKILDGRCRVEKPKRRSNRLLAGLLRCGRCASAMTPTSTKKGNRCYSYYQCATVDRVGAQACPGSRIAAADIEAVVLDQVRRIGENPALARNVAREAKGFVSGDREEKRARVVALAQQRDALEVKRRGALDEVGRNGRSARPLHEALGEITVELDRVEADLREAEAQLTAMEKIEVVDADVREALRAFGPVWKELFPKEKARIAEALIESVTYEPGTDDVEIEFRPEAVGLIANHEDPPLQS